MGADLVSCVLCQGCRALTFALARLSCFEELEEVAPNKKRKKNNKMRRPIVIVIWDQFLV